MLASKAPATAGPGGRWLEALSGKATCDQTMSHTPLNRSENEKCLHVRNASGKAHSTTHEARKAVGSCVTKLSVTLGNAGKQGQSLVY